jgi:hypothetical protein
MIRILLSTLLSFLTFYAFCQNGTKDSGKALNRYFHIGPLVSIPAFDYADTDIENDYSGFARTGYGISFGYKEFLDKSPGYLHLGFDAIYQPTTLYSEAEKFFESTGDYAASQVENPAYLSFPMKTGLGLGTRKVNNNFYIEALLGFTLTKMLKGSMHVEQLMPISGDERGTVRTETKWGQVVTFGGEIGYMPNDRFAISVEYIQAHDATIDYISRGVVSGSDWTMHQQMFNLKAQFILGKR